MKSNGYGEDLLLSQIAYVKRLTHGTVTRSIPQSNLFEIGLDGGHGRIKVNIMKPRLLRLILPENPASDLRIPVSELEWLRVEEVRWS